MAELISWIDARQEREARRLVAMIHQGRFEQFAAELGAMNERTACRRSQRQESK